MFTSDHRRIAAHKGDAWPHVREVWPTDSHVAISRVTNGREDRTTSTGLDPPGHDISTFAISLNNNRVTKKDTF
jgi:hypothetical protein